MTWSANCRPAARFPSLLGLPRRPDHGAGVKHYHHHVVGDLALSYLSSDLRADAGLSMTIYAAEPGFPTAHALALLGSWAATDENQLADSN